VVVVGEDEIFPDTVCDGVFWKEERGTKRFGAKLRTTSIGTF